VERLVESEKMRSLLEAARWAPSSNNAQPWRFVVATKDRPADYDRLFDCLLEGNKKWVHRAPVLILSVAKLAFDDGSPNRHALHDVGLATENLALQAAALGLASHPMAGFQIDKARNDLAIPDGYEPVAMIAVGYPGDPAVLPDRLRDRELAPRSRMALMELVYAGLWGAKSSLIE
jgi:nitroreductase